MPSEALFHRDASLAGLPSGPAGTDRHRSGTGGPFGTALVFEEGFPRHPAAAGLGPDLRSAREDRIAQVDAVLAETRRLEKITRGAQPLRVSAAYDGLDIAL